jgi:hypothetical protein
MADWVRFSSCPASVKLFNRAAASNAFNSEKFGTRLMENGLNIHEYDSCFHEKASLVNHFHGDEDGTQFTTQLRHL